MLPIQRVAGHMPGLSWGTSYNGFAWAVAIATDRDLDLYGQTVSTLAEIDRVLDELGTDKTRLLNATVYITNMQLRDEMHRAWCEWIGENPQDWPQRRAWGPTYFKKPWSRSWWLPRAVDLRSTATATPIRGVSQGRQSS